jgi:hypothetical protein
MNKPRPLPTFPVDVVKEACVSYYNEAVQFTRGDIRHNAIRFLINFEYFIAYMSGEPLADIAVRAELNQESLRHNFIRVAAMIDRYLIIKEKERKGTA